MVTNLYVGRLDEHENRLIKRLREHPVLSQLRRLDNPAFEDLQLQRSLLSSRGFTHFYDLISMGLNDEAGLKAIGLLISAEYPKGQVSHRVDMRNDLEATGLSRRRIVDTVATPLTQRTIGRLLGLASYAGRHNEDHYDIEVISAARVAGEVLVAEEYEFILIERYRRYGSKSADSVFYEPHHRHDRKTRPLGEGGESHADGLGTIIVNLVDSEDKLVSAIAAMEEACQLKCEFYDQF